MLNSSPKQEKHARSVGDIRDTWTRYKDDHNVVIPHDPPSDASPEQGEVDPSRMGVHSQGGERRVLEAVVDKMGRLEDRLQKQLAIERALVNHVQERADDRGEIGLGAGTLQRAAARLQEPNAPEAATGGTPDNFHFQAEMGRLQREVAVLPRAGMKGTGFQTQPQAWSPLHRSDWEPPYTPIWPETHNANQGQPHQHWQQQHQQQQQQHEEHQRQQALLRGPDVWLI